MSTPVQQQPSFELHPTDIYMQSHYQRVSPYGPPAILGPIVPSTTRPQKVGPQPTIMTCHMCNQEIKTVIYHRPTVKTHLFAACLCIIGMFPFMCIPYCMHSCNKTDHYCPYCSAFMGSHVLD